MIFSCLLYLCTKCHCFKRYREAPFTYRRGGFNTLDQSSSSDDFSAPSELYQQDIIIPRAKKAVSTSDRDLDAARLAHYLDDSLRIPRPHVHDGSSMASGDSEYTIAEEIERRVITDVKTTETRTVTTEADVHGGASTTVETSYRTYGGGESGMRSSSASSQQVRICSQSFGTRARTKYLTK